MTYRYVAIGDSFTEGLGDPRPDGSDRGWADLFAEALAETTPGGIEYANLAIRGRKLEHLLAEQLPAALALKPDLISINGGGNDMLRPTMSISRANGLLRDAVRAATRQGATVLLSSAADPSDHLPLGGVVRARGEALAAALLEWAKVEPRVGFVDNSHDPLLRAPESWSADGLHLNSAGHARVAINNLCVLDRPIPEWLIQLSTELHPRLNFRSRVYYKEHVLPWLERRLRGQSSGDGRPPKRPIPTLWEGR